MAHRAAGVDKKQVGYEAGEVEYKKMCPNWRTALHHQREDRGQHRDVQDRFEQSPAVAELGIAEPGAGLANDQCLNDAALRVKALAETGQGLRDRKSVVEGK